MTEDDLIAIGHGLIQATRGGVAAGAEVDHNRVVRAAPIVKWLVGWTPAEALKMLRERGYRISIQATKPRAEP